MRLLYLFTGIDNVAECMGIIAELLRLPGRRGAILDPCHSCGTGLPVVLLRACTHYSIRVSSPPAGAQGSATTIYCLPLYLSRYSTISLSLTHEDHEQSGPEHNRVETLPPMSEEWSERPAKEHDEERREECLAHPVLLRTQLLKPAHIPLSVSRSPPSGSSGTGPAVHAQMHVGAHRREDKADVMQRLLQRLVHAMG